MCHTGKEPSGSRVSLMMSPAAAKRSVEKSNLLMDAKVFEACLPCDLLVSARCTMPKGMLGLPLEEVSDF